MRNRWYPQAAAEPAIIAAPFSGWRPSVAHGYPSSSSSASAWTVNENDVDLLVGLRPRDQTPLFTT